MKVFSLYVQLSTLLFKVVSKKKKKTQSGLIQTLNNIKNILNCKLNVHVHKLIDELIHMTNMTPYTAHCVWWQLHASINNCIAFFHPAG